MKELTVYDVITASGKYPERLNNSELTPEVIKNIEELIKRVTNLLKELNINQSITITSGFRPSSVNANIKGASKKSAHMIGKALDISDTDNKLGKLIRQKQNNLGTAGILSKHGLMMEAIESTPTWCHLDILVRIPRPSMEFKP